MTDAQHQPIANDFVNVWAAGQLTLDGNPAAAYDWPTHRTVEVHAVGHDFDGYYGWHYPPTFLFVAAALATLPYLPAAILWLAATLSAFVAAMATILGGRTGLLVACGFPAATWNVTAGQNGFLTAALIGGTLGLMERRTALAGVCLGLLTYKPQFGLLFPNRADRRPAMAHDRGRLLRRRRSCCAVMARLWQCQLASLCALDADHQQFCRYGKVVRHSN